MQFSQLNGGPLGDAEKVYAAVRNVAGATLSAGAAAFFVVTTPDGISVSNCGSKTRKYAFAGVLPVALADSAYGRAQVYGIGSAYMVLSSTAVSAVPGQQLDTVDSAAYLKDFIVSDYFLSGALSGTAQGNPWNFVTLMDTYASAASANSTPLLKSVFIRA